MLLKINKIINETEDIKTFIFEKQKINFKSGQFLNYKLDVKDPRSSTRSFSIASSPTENFLMLSTKISQSPFKQMLNLMNVNDEIEAAGPYGIFILDEIKDVVMLSGGIGITPLRSMIKYSLDKKLKVKITLFYSNKIPEDILYRKELETFAKNRNFTLVNTITEPKESKESWKGITGRIDENLIKKYVKDFNNKIFYICGPPKMVDAMVEILKGMNIPQQQIKIEHFLGY